ncbi:MAG: thermonuclease family protein [Desulfobacterium sp.]|nr:thermonuclease family protein [Desulfobacterium sp.]
MTNLKLKLKPGIVLRTILLVLIVLLNTGTGYAELYKVLRVVDGDTIDVDFHGRKERVRLLCVDTPESVHPDRSKNTPLGTIASLYAKERLTGKSVDLEFEGKRRGRYKRLLAYVIVGDSNFNLDLVEKGFSPYYTKYGRSDAYDQKFRHAEQMAKEKGLNIWSERATETKTEKQRSAYATANLGPAILHGNAQSKVFHAPSCRYFNCKQCTVIFPTKEAAQEAGFKPCRICKP